MWSREWWLNLIEKQWERRSVVWLSGVRRAGKTVICQSIGGAEYFDCELPSVRVRLADPEAFWSAMRGKRVALDEVQKLPDPSGLLKIAADHYPEVRVIATGSSTLHASAKFRDTLTGRKADVWLTPMIAADCAAFQQTDLAHRTLGGGLPPFFLASEPSETEFQEWIDSFWARDIQELFRLERRWSFGRFLELLLVQSGGMFEATRFAAPCEVSRTTISNYLSVLERTRVVHVLRPFSEGGPSEITSAPKVYGFDTGFVCCFRGWRPLRPEDLGAVWDHIVLNEMHARLQRTSVAYWRDKRGHEIDFVLARRDGAPTAVECKWSVTAPRVDGLAAFRRRYPEGENWLVAADVSGSYERSFGGIPVTVMGLDALAARLQSSGRLQP